jgi:hypothetical protein
MHELAKETISLVSGGYYKYVTEEWKHNEAVALGLLFGFVGLSFGTALLLDEVTVFALATTIVGGASGYIIGYQVSQLQTSCYEDNTLCYIY